MMKKKVFFKYLVIFIIAIFSTITLVCSGIVLKYYFELPNISELVENYTPSVPTVIYDRNNQIIDMISKEDRKVAKIQTIPLHLQNAFIAIEDRKFREHYGIDPIRILGSIFVNLKSGRAAQGGSTITQQLARNAFLSQEKTFARKIKEVLITLGLERRYTKDELMEKYLNEIYFGAGSYGVKNTSLAFFRKDISDINLAEAALLAGIPNRPSLYNPRTNLRNAVKRQQLILKQMLKYSFITEEEYKEAFNHIFINEQDAVPQDFMDKDTTIVYEESNRNIEFNAPDFTDLVENFLFEHFSETDIYNNGLKVETTLDLNIQRVAKEVFESYDALQKNENLQGAMVTMDVKNGEIISVIGGKNFKSHNFNRAFQAKRQYGSAYKTFVYYTALETGIEPSSIIEDTKEAYGKWTPKNFGNIYYNGITVLQGFEKSQNHVSIKLLKNATLSALNKNLKKLNSGLKSVDNLTAALGTTEGTALSLAESYAIFANGGYTIKPYFIKKITDKFGNLLYESTPELEHKFNTRDIALMTAIMKNSVKEGTSRRAKVIVNGKGIEQGGKTGTTNNSRTVWYSVITPDYVTTIYLGYDNNESLEKATGGSYAAPLWRNFYEAIIKRGYYTPTTFNFLETYLKNGDLVEQHLNPLNGLLSNSPSSKTFTVRRGKISVETDEKYRNGIRGVLEN